MSFNDIKNQIKKTYNSAVDNIVEDFYNIVLSEAVRYDRISGFFSSTSLAIAARGMDHFIQNGGHMRLLCSCKLSETDLTAINNSQDYKEYISKEFLEDIDNLEDELIKNHVKMLGWMISNDLLEIKIGLNIKDNQNDSMLHIKKGILYDSDEQAILFEGSVNETAYGWYNNIESFKVFNSWNTNEYIMDDIKIFEDFWNNKNESLEVIDVPDACKNKLVEIAPKTEHEFKKLNTFFKSKKPILRDYQKKAIDIWIKNNCQGIFSMATGTGKTFTALSALDQLNKKNSMLNVIVCPQNHLINQWEDNIKQFGINYKVIIASGDNGNWEEELFDSIIDINCGITKNIIILTNFDIFCKEKFIKCIEEYEDISLIIVDEVHGVGSGEYSKGLLNSYNYRLGLSATPDIEDDLERTDL